MVHLMPYHPLSCSLHNPRSARFVKHLNVLRLLEMGLADLLCTFMAFVLLHSALCSNSKWRKEGYMEDRSPPDHDRLVR